MINNLITLVVAFVTHTRTLIAAGTAVVAMLMALGFSWNSPFAWAEDVRALQTKVQSLQVQGDSTTIETMKTRKAVLEGQLFDVEQELAKHPESRALRIRKRELEAEIADIDRQIAAKGKHT